MRPAPQIISNRHLISLERRKLITKTEWGRTNIIELSSWFLSKGNVHKGFIIVVLLLCIVRSALNSCIVRTSSSLPGGRIGLLGW